MSILEPQSPSALASRHQSGPVLFSDENLTRLAWLLDESIPLPGTRFRIGIGPLIGLVPGLGDVLSGLISCIIPLAAWLRGLPYITILRMVVNIGIDVGIGTIPILGDAFDFAWKPDQRNMRLLKRHIAEPHRHGWRDWGFLLLLVGGIFGFFLLCIAVVVVAAYLLWHAVFAAK
jgi:hypothetical protein